MVAQYLRLSDSEMAQKSPPKRRADFGRRRQHRRDAGLDPDVERTPHRIADLDRLEDRRGHGEHAGIAARHHGDAAAGGGERQRVTRAIELDAIVGRMAALIGAQHRHAVEIGAVAHEIRRRGEGSLRRGCHQLGLARTGADDDERAGHSRLPSPGISTIAKYTPAGSPQSASGRMRSSCMVPRST